MSHFSEEVTVATNPERIFVLYEDVANWRRWDKEVASSSIDGPFAAGTVGQLKPTRGPEAGIKIIAVEKNKSFTVVSRLPMCALVFEHELLPEKDSTRVIHQVSFHGPLSFLFSRVIGEKLRKGLACTLQGLKQAAETVTL